MMKTTTRATTLLVCPECHLLEVDANCCSRCKSCEECRKDGLTCSECFFETFSVCWVCERLFEDDELCEECDSCKGCCRCFEMDFIEEGDDEDG